MTRARHTQSWQKGAGSLPDCPRLGSVVDSIDVVWSGCQDPKFGVFCRRNETFDEVRGGERQRRGSSEKKK